MFWERNTCDTEITGTPRIMVVVAFYRELQPFLDLAEVITSCKIKGVTYYLMEQEGEEFLLYMSGVGPKRSHRSTKKTLKHFKATSLIFSGIAANLIEGNEFGETLVARKWQYRETGEIVEVDKELLSVAESLGDVRVVETGLTSKLFVQDTSQLPQGASMVDMEAHAIGKIAQENKVPFIAIRTLSDNADGKEEGSDFDIAGRKSAIKTLEFINLLKKL